VRAALAALQDSDGGNRRQESRLPSRCSCFIPIGAHHYNFLPSIIRIWLRICKEIADPSKKLNDDNGGIMDLELWCVWTCSSEAIWDALPGNTPLGFGNCKKSWIAWSETVTETGTETVPMPRLEMTKKKKTSTTSLAMRAMEESWFETASSNGACHAWIKVLTTFTYIYYAITAITEF